MADIAFTVGIMSLMDTLFGLPMKEILAETHVSEEVEAALMHRQGHYGELLLLAENLERINETAPQLTAALEKMELTTDDLNQIEVAAFEWSDSVSRAAA